MPFAQAGQGVDIFSQIGILIFVIGVIYIVGIPVAMIKFGRKDLKNHRITIKSLISNKIMGLWNAYYLPYIFTKNSLNSKTSK